MCITSLFPLSIQIKLPKRYKYKCLWRRRRSQAGIWLRPTQFVDISEPRVAAFVTIGRSSK